MVLRGARSSRRPNIELSMRTHVRRWPVPLLLMPYTKVFLCTWMSRDREVRRAQLPTIGILHDLVSAEFVISHCMRAFHSLHLNWRPSVHHTTVCWVLPASRSALVPGRLGCRSAGLIRDMLAKLQKKAAQEADHNAYCVRMWRRERSFMCRQTSSRYRM